MMLWCYYLGMVWMIKMSCPRTDSFTSTLVSENNHPHPPKEKKRKQSLFMCEAEWEDIQPQFIHCGNEGPEDQPYLYLTLDKPLTCPTRPPSVWGKNKQAREVDKTICRGETMWWWINLLINRKIICNHFGNWLIIIFSAMNQNILSFQVFKCEGVLLFCFI